MDWIGSFSSNYKQDTDNLLKAFDFDIAKVAQIKKLPYLNYLELLYSFANQKKQ